MIWGISNESNKTADFDAIIEEVDKDLLDTQPSSNPTVANIVRESLKACLWQFGYNFFFLFFLE